MKASLTLKVLAVCPYASVFLSATAVRRQLPELAQDDGQHHAGPRARLNFKEAECAQCLKRRLEGTCFEF